MGQGGIGTLMCSQSPCGPYPQCVPGQQHLWGHQPFLLMPSGQKVSKNEAQETLFLFKSGCKPQGLPVLLLLPSSSE